MIWEWRWLSYVIDLKSRTLKQSLGDLIHHKPGILCDVIIYLIRKYWEYILTTCDMLNIKHTMILTVTIQIVFVLYNQGTSVTSTIMFLLSLKSLNLKNHTRSITLMEVKHKKNLIKVFFSIPNKSPLMNNNLTPKLTNSLFIKLTKRIYISVA